MMEVRRGFQMLKVSRQSEVALLAFVTSNGIHVALESEVDPMDSFSTVENALNLSEPITLEASDAQ